MQAGRDNIILQFAQLSLTPEQIEILVRAIVHQESSAQDKIAEVGERLGITESAVKNFFRILGERQVLQERLLETLAEIAERHLTLLKQIRSLQSDDPEIAELRTQAALAIDQGTYDKAETLLAEAEERDLAASRQLQSIANKRLLNAAATRAERGELSLTQLDYLAAAAHFKTASEQVPQADIETRTDYLNRYALALFNYGDEKGDNAILRQAIEVYQKNLTELPRERVPLDWAMTQNNLGNALRTLGERESGTARLEEAVEAFREALKERIRERVPLSWALTQDNLGAALAILGERESGTGRLEEAVEAFREALKERISERVPLDWAMTQNNLGNALRTLGERESGTARLEKAVEAYREALKERTRERVALDWAMTQNNLGNALQILGELGSGTARLEEAVAAYREALSVFEAANIPPYIERTRRNLQKTIQTLAARNSH